MIEREKKSEENKEALQQKSSRQLWPTEISVNGKKKSICKVSCNMELLQKLKLQRLKASNTAYLG